MFQTMTNALMALPMQLGTGNFLYLAVVFFVIALVAALVGFRGVAGISASAARLFVVVFLVLAVISLLL
ncbi:DUF1328 domain-containing protein [Halomarina litorea]|uniref:DUF1328 domain-containing protein n=1 Tax=Halomarina litorea TaxID=2961595 RepID=UPI0020C2E546|nr:DUF1328 family protein [Halomarina sp. BCD28]